ncbi:hypothetical protein [Halorussus salinisoli]|uniref:hypothetical protein n=1 Tax=Halorussus salinisoli TaxID=2558242 RepID=UPI0010C22379|nr:hypothetical protein [Halorussus salinisoli]
MKCPPIRTDALGASADGVASVFTAFVPSAGVIPAGADDAGRVGNTGDNGYRLERTIPTA